MVEMSDLDWQEIFFVNGIAYFLIFVAALIIWDKTGHEFTMRNVLTATAIAGALAFGLMWMLYGADIIGTFFEWIEGK